MEIKPPDPKNDAIITGYRKSAYKSRRVKDASVLLACAELGSFAAAGQALNLDITTVSRRITDLEQTISTQLFRRSPSGIELTQAGRILAKCARDVRDADANFRAMAQSLSIAAAPTLTIGSTEGFLTFVLIPILMGQRLSQQPLDQSIIKGPIDNLAFTTDMARADVALIQTDLQQPPATTEEFQITPVGTSHFNIMHADGPGFASPKSFDDLANIPVIDVDTYSSITSLRPWHNITANNPHRRRVRTVIELPKPLLTTPSVTILPDYATLYERKLQISRLKMPTMRSSLWLIDRRSVLAHNPTAKQVHDAIISMFRRSVWFQPKPYMAA